MNAPDTSALSRRSAGRPFVWYWLPVIVWCGLIFVQSAYPTPGKLPSWPHFDKVLHMCGYALLGGLVCRALETIGSIRERRMRRFLVGLVLATLYGLTDEWHQSFVPGRSATVADALADMVGAGVGSAVWLMLRARLNRTPRL